MDKDAIKDYSATGLGGVSGMDMLYTGINGMLDNGVDAPEIKLVVYGLIAIITGFFAWRRDHAAQKAQAAPAA
ncbi:MAG: hypothetical protein HY348_01765 [Nitrospira defluvii]|nr:hypothetical protein [Nitrospira defluvii]